MEKHEIASYAEAQKAETLRLPAEQLFNRANFDDDWMLKRACVDVPTGVFFPDDRIGLITAQKICEVCEVKKECLGYAIDNSIEYGVWGGVSEKDRILMIRKAVFFATKSASGR